MPPVTHSAFSTNTCTVVASKREAWDAVAASNHGDEAKKKPYRAKGGATNTVNVSTTFHRLRTTTWLKAAYMMT